jgi:hypothetical protein
MTCIMLKSCHHHIAEPSDEQSHVFFCDKRTRLLKEIASHETIIGPCFTDKRVGGWNLFRPNRQGVEKFQTSHEAGDDPCSAALGLCAGRSSASLAL